MVIELKQRVANIEKEVKGESPVRVFVQIDKDSLYTIGKESFITDLIARAGGESVTKTVATAYPKISKETALALNPDAIILSESPNNLEPNEVFKNSNAVKNGKVFKINADIISRPSPRLVDALEQIAEFLTGAQAARLPERDSAKTAFVKIQVNSRQTPLRRFSSDVASEPLALQSVAF